VASSRGCRYTEGEVRALVYGFPIWKELRGTHRAGIGWIVRLADIDRALHQLPSTLRLPVLLHGLIGLEQEEAAPYLECSQQTVSRRFSEGIAAMTRYLNGEDE
jgi:hypothetical protein